MEEELIEEYHFIDFPVFGYRHIIIYTNNITLSRKKINNKVGRPKHELGKNVDGLHSYHKADPDGFIFFTEESTIGTISHEIFHALWQMFKYYGCKLENETFAYHLGYMLDDILKFKSIIDRANKFKNKIVCKQ